MRGLSEANTVINYLETAVFNLVHECVQSAPVAVYFALQYMSGELTESPAQ